MTESTIIDVNDFLISQILFIYDRRPTPAYIGFHCDKLHVNVHAAG